MISIIIPVRNEAAYIERCLESVLAQDFAGHDYEVIVVDGMSEDDTPHILEKFKSQNPKIKIIKNEKKTVSAGVNLGIRESRGEIIVRMDAHAQYAADYIKACLRTMERTGAANVGGPVLPLPGGDSSMALSIALAHLSPFGLGGGSFRHPEKEGYVETVWPGCFHRQALMKSGLLDERLTRTEDIELNSRIRYNGGRIYLSPKIRAYYLSRTKLGDLFRQRWLDGKGVVQTLAVNSRALRWRHFVPLAFVASLLVLILLSCLDPRFGYLLIAELGFYVLAMIIFTVAAIFEMQKYVKSNILRIEPKSKVCRALWLLPLAFITLHFSYGLGSLWAVLTWPWWWHRFHQPLRFVLDK